MNYENNWALKNLNGPLMISWDITNNCNFNCIHCLNRSNDNKAHDLSHDFNKQDIDNIIGQILEVKPYSICICGGEPTLSKYLFDIISRISSTGIQVNMVSNGFLIDEEYVRNLVKSGLAFIQISLDSSIEVEHDVFRDKKGAFQHAVRALKLLTATKIKTAVSMAPTKFNIFSFEKYVEFIQSLGCNHVRLMPLLPMGRGFDNFEKIEPNEEEYFGLKMAISELKVKNLKLIIEWGDPLEHIYLSKYLPRPQPIVLEIRSNGDIAPSIYLPVSCGNLKRHRIKEYWEGGFNQIWANPIVKEMAESINTIEDFKEMSHRTWNIKRRQFDLLEDITND